MLAHLSSTNIHFLMTNHVLEISLVAPASLYRQGLMNKDADNRLSFTLTGRTMPLHNVDCTISNAGGKPIAK